MFIKIQHTRSNSPEDDLIQEIDYKIGEDAFVYKGIEVMFDGDRGDVTIMAKDSSKTLVMRTDGDQLFFEVDE